MKHIFVFVLILLVTINITACSSDDPIFPDDKADLEKEREQQEIISDFALSERHFNDAVAIADQAGLLGYLVSFKTMDVSNIMASCAKIQFDTSDISNHIMIDFGDSNCSGKDERLRRGRIIIEFTEKYRETGSLVTIHFDHYYVDNVQIIGKKTVENIGKNSQGNITFYIEVDGRLIFEDNTVHTTKSSRTRTWIEGANTFVWADDVFHIEGSGKGVSRNGKEYSFSTLEPLRLELSCRWIVSGILEIKPEQLETGILDYGKGDCNNIATLTSGDNSWVIKMR